MANIRLYNVANSFSIVTNIALYYLIEGYPWTLQRTIQVNDGKQNIAYYGNNYPIKFRLTSDNSVTNYDACFLYKYVSDSVKITNNNISDYFYTGYTEGSDVSGFTKEKISFAASGDYIETEQDSTAYSYTSCVYIVPQSFGNSFETPTVTTVTPEITATNCSVSITNSSGVDVSSGFESGTLVNLNVSTATGYTFESLVAVFNDNSGISRTIAIDDTSNLPYSIYPYDSLVITATAKDTRTLFTIRTSLYNCTLTVLVNGIESTDLTYYKGDTIQATLHYDTEKYSVNWKTSYITNYNDTGDFTYFTSDTITVTANSDNRLFIKGSCYLLLKNDFIRNYIVTPDDLTLIAENRFSYYSSEITTYFRDIAQYVIDFKRFYCTLPEYGVEPIKIGYWQIENSNCAVCDDLLVYLPLYSFEPIEANTAFDVANTELKLFLPYIGVVDLDASIYLNNAFDIQYIVDVITGNCTATISIDDNVIETHNGVISQKIPFNVDTRYTDISSNNNLANNSDTIALAIIRPTMQNAHYTATINKRGKVSNFTGFCRFDNVDVSNIPCDYDTQNEIINILNKGVIL